jgi:dsDNA-specific endonuclease/ATPase MutS2
MNIIESEALELLEFYKIKKYVTDFCHSSGAKNKASHISVFENHENLTLNYIVFLN